jgi:predicted phage terminase large subunit-like protein
MISLLQLQKELNNRSYYEFVKYFWSVVDTSKFIDCWYIKDLCDILQEIVLKNIRKEKARDLLINIPPGTSKTMIVVRLLNAWAWTISPKLKFISCSYSDELAEEGSMKTKELVLSEEYRAMYSVKIKKNRSSNSNFENYDGGRRIAVGIKGSLTSRHGDILIFDDPENPKMAHSEAERKTSKQGLSTLSTRKTDALASVTIVIQQRLHPEDVSSVVLGTWKDFDHISLPAIYNENIKPEAWKEKYIDGKYLNKIRLGDEALEKLKSSLGSRDYFAQIMQDPSDEQGGLLKRDWFKFFDNIEYKECFMIIDTAQEKKEQNDFTAIGIFARIGQYLYMLEMYNLKLEYPEQKKKIIELQKQWECRCIYIEKKSNGNALIQELKNEYGYNVKAIERSGKGSDKVSRANAVSPKIEGGFCYIRQHHIDFLMQATAFPNSKHDDMIDVFISAIEELLMGKNNNIIQHRQVLF